MSNTTLYIKRFVPRRHPINWDVLIDISPAIAGLILISTITLRCLGGN